MSEDRRGDFIVTYTGRLFWPLDPRPEEIDVVDVAHHLSTLNRFTGAARLPISVAEHSCHVSDLLPPELRLWGLLHDAAEAYLGDVSRPVKIQPEFSFYRTAERRVMRAVCARFDLPWPEPPEVKVVDNAVGEAERLAQMANVPLAIWFGEEPAPIDLSRPWTEKRAEREFLRRFERLVLPVAA